MKNIKLLAVVACVGVVLAGASSAFAASNGNGGSVIGIGSFNNGGARAGNGGSGNSGSGGDGGNVEAIGSNNNGGASAGSGGNGGSVQNTTNKLQLLKDALNIRLSLRAM